MLQLLDEEKRAPVGLEQGPRKARGQTRLGPEGGAQGRMGPLGGAICPAYGEGGERGARRARLGYRVCRGFPVVRSARPLARWLKRGRLGLWPMRARHRLSVKAAWANESAPVPGGGCSGEVSRPLERI